MVGIGTVLISRLRSRANLILARWLVDTEYYLERYPDVRAAGVDPIRHFAEFGYAIPIRAANPLMEKTIARISPLLMLALVMSRIQRDDWLQCFVAHYEDLSCGDLGLEYRLVRWVARLLAKRDEKASGPRLVSQNRIFGITLPIARIADGFPWLSVKMIELPATHRFSSPRVWRARSEPIPYEITLPPLWCATVQQASVFGAMQVAANGYFVVYEPAADPSLSFTAGQYRYIFNCFRPETNKVVARIPDKATIHADEAILLGGRCSNNHFHFLIEYLSRGYLIDRLDLAEDIPLVISDNLFPPQMEAIRIFFPSRRLIAMSSQQRLDVKRLHIPSLMTYLPDALEITDWKKEGLRYASLHWLRERAYEALSSDTDTWMPPSRIFLARRRGRNIVNADEVEAVFANHGFTSVDPSQMNFVEQVRLFSAATHVAGPLGAAFSNTIFCRPGTSVLGLGSHYAATSSLFQNLAELMGCNCLHLLSDKKKSDILRLRKNKISLRQGSYTINTRRLNDLLNSWTLAA